MTEHMAIVYDFATGKRLTTNPPRDESRTKESLRSLTVLAERFEREARLYRTQIGQIAMRLADEATNERGSDDER